MNRAKRIEEYRLRQPLEELERKAVKAHRKDIWTQEELDAAKAWARDLARLFQPLPTAEDND